MSIPNFKSQEDWQEFLNIFDDQWQCKREMLNRVKDDMLPGYNWDQIQPKTLEVINDIVSNLVYECERQFKETHQDYKTDDDDMFIPYRSFKENVLEALNEALTPYDLVHRDSQ
ncbi:hypothetical protein BOW92_gp195 [Synechococcus phage S-WAM1]|uniref:Uncharacterized protein n=1 Tax=Synechococcus phage S-WAM1 TaxID=1815521 RepID=A0A1D8KS96_9CAUD|nr:hypothetical protein BOW92_gp195 [Synechococcus phage S-WAM1]AOV61522.1 hypothetical protein P090810_049 [Synechococcus phage S-WAM1]